MYDIKVKKIAPIEVISKSAPVNDFATSGEINVALFREVREHVLNNGAGYAGYDIALYHGIPTQTNLSLEAAIPVSEALPINDNMKRYELPAVDMMASLIHYGGYDSYHLAHGAMQQWIADNGYRQAGAVRDVYLVFDIAGDPDKYVTELQYPIQVV